MIDSFSSSSLKTRKCRVRTQHTLGAFHMVSSGNQMGCLKLNMYLIPVLGFSRRWRFMSWPSDFVTHDTNISHTKRNKKNVFNSAAFALKPFGSKCYLW